MSLDRITHPLRLAKGSHQPGSGKGCAMNVISYINGDVQITDYPDCSARPLAAIVQGLNDHLAGPDGFLSPEDSVIVLDIGWRTVGTANTPSEVVWRWLADILTHPEMGVVKFAEPDGVKAIRHVSDLCMREAGGVWVSPQEWQSSAPAPATSSAAYAVAASAAAASSYAYAVASSAYAAYAAAYASADAAAYAAAYAYASAGNGERINFAQWAVEHWRNLAGLDAPNEIESEAVDYALARMQ